MLKNCPDERVDEKSNGYGYDRVSLERRFMISVTRSLYGFIISKYKAAV